MDLETRIWVNGFGNGGLRNVKKCGVFNHQGSLNFNDLKSFWTCFISSIPFRLDLYCRL